MAAPAITVRLPAHREPLVAAGAVVLATGILLAQIRLEDPVGDGVHLLYAAAAAALVGGLGLRAHVADAAPTASRSVLLVTGLILLAVTLVRLADVLGAGDEGYAAGAFVWAGALFAAVALCAAVRERSALCGFLAAVGAVVAALNALQWLFAPDSGTPFRVLLVLMALGCVLLSLVLRGPAHRSSVLMVDLAGLLVMVLALSLVGLLEILAFRVPFGDGAGTLWELLILVAACGLIAFGAVDRQPGPALIGVVNLAVFVGLASSTSGGEVTLLYWPILLLLLGGGVMAAGLRRNHPLPPEPAPYAAGERPLASRVDDETVIAVHVDD